MALLGHIGDQEVQHDLLQRHRVRFHKRAVSGSFIESCGQRIAL